MYSYNGLTHSEVEKIVDDKFARRDWADFMTSLFASDRTRSEIKSIAQAETKSEVSRNVPILVTHEISKQLPNVINSNYLVQSVLLEHNKKVSDQLDTKHKEFLAKMQKESNEIIAKVVSDPSYNTVIEAHKQHMNNIAKEQETRHTKEFKEFLGRQAEINDREMALFKNMRKENDELKSKMSQLESNQKYYERVTKILGGVTLAGVVYAITKL